MNANAYHTVTDANGDPIGLHKGQGIACDLCDGLAIPTDRRTTKCGVRRAYRTLADTGSRERCGNPAVTPAGFCRRHDPETRPKRDKQGRILPREPKYLQNPCLTCGAPMLGAHLHETRDAEDEDPTPWCNACGARTRSECHCGPIAENE